MKNWFIKRREDVVIAGLVVLACIMVTCFTISGINDIKNTTVTFDDGIEEIELTEEMVETYVTLANMALED